jgi:hypothetical protein
MPEIWNEKDLVFDLTDAVHLQADSPLHLQFPSPDKLDDDKQKKRERVANAFSKTFGVTRSASRDPTLDRSGSHFDCDAGDDSPQSTQDKLKAFLKRSGSSRQGTQSSLDATTDFSIVRSTSNLEDRLSVPAVSRSATRDTDAFFLGIPEDQEDEHQNLTAAEIEKLGMINHPWADSTQSHFLDRESLMVFSHNQDVKRKAQHMRKSRTRQKAHEMKERMKKGFRINERRRSADAAFHTLIEESAPPLVPKSFSEFEPPSRSRGSRPSSRRARSRHRSNFDSLSTKSSLTGADSLSLHASSEPHGRRANPLTAIEEPSILARAKSASRKSLGQVSSLGQDDSNRHSLQDVFCKAKSVSSLSCGQDDDSNRNRHSMKSDRLSVQFPSAVASEQSSDGIITPYARSPYSGVGSEKKVTFGMHPKSKKSSLQDRYACSSLSSSSSLQLDQYMQLDQFNAEPMPMIITKQSNSFLSCISERSEISSRLSSRLNSLVRAPNSAASRRSLSRPRSITRASNSTSSRRGSLLACASDGSLHKPN